MAENKTSRNWMRWAIPLLALAALALASGNVFLHTDILALQQQLTERQKFISEGVRLSKFNTEFVKTLAELSATTNDEAIRNLLANHGITYTVNATLPTDSGEQADGR